MSALLALMARMDADRTISDIDLAGFLSMKGVTTLRRFIAENAEELKTYGPLLQLAKAGQKNRCYYLNAQQALIVSFRVRTQSAAELRADFIRSLQEGPFSLSCLLEEMGKQ